MSARLFGPTIVRVLARPLPRPAAIAVVACLSLIGLVIYARHVHTIYPLQEWLAWPLLAVWGYTALANLTWFSIGALITGRWLRQRDLPHLERAVLSMAVGVLAFTELMYVAGAVGLYGPWFALGLAGASILAGARELALWWRRYREAPPPEQQPAGSLLLLLWAVGGALTFILYLGVFSPDAVNYDASWCHLTVAQDYARTGRIVAFPGDYSKNVPQLAALLRTWDFSVPGLSPVLRWMLCLHQEFGLFVWTLAGVAAAVRFIARDQSVRGAWVGFYLFPIIFVYDHNLGGAADHIAAFFTLPGLIAAGRLLERLELGRGLALVACMAGGFLTKYQSFYWILPLAVVVAVVWVRGLSRARTAPLLPAGRSRALLTLPVWLSLAFALLVLPHFLRNWLFYRNPLYPFAQQIFTGTRPTIDDAIFLFNNIFIDLNWVPEGSAWSRLLHALELSMTFSFTPHYSFTNYVPVFGSLFTLLLPAVLCIKERRYVLLAAFVGMATLLLWGYTFNVDRNLQVFMPILVATTSALILGVARLGWIARAALAPLVAFQIVWGADATFYSSKVRIESALNLIASGFERKARQRFQGYRAAFLEISRSLPLDARVLLHMSHINLGINRELVLDWAGYQSLISYSKVRGPGELLELYRRLGITHLLYSPGERPDSSLQGEVAFQALVRWLGRPTAQAGGLRLLELPLAGPPAEPPYQVLLLDVSGYGSGVFPIERLRTVEYLPPSQRHYEESTESAPTTAADLNALQVDVVVTGVGAKLNRAQKAFLQSSFVPVVTYSRFYTVYLRRPPTGA